MTERVLEGRGKVIIMLLDGFGYKLLEQAVRMGEQTAFSHMAELETVDPLTTTFPSTTATALSSVNTGRTPLEHGIIGYTSYLKEFGLVANMINFSPAVDRRQNVLTNLGLDLKNFLGVETIYEMLARAGYRSTVITRNFYKNSALSKMLHRGATIRTFANSSDLFVSLRKHLEKDPDSQEFIFVYWEGLDTSAHAYGPFSDEVFAELRGLSFYLHTEVMQRLERKAAKNSALLITGDHGLAEVTRDETITTSEHPEIMNCLQIPPTGDARAVFLNTKPGHTGALQKILFKLLEDEIRIISTKDVIHNGLLGSGRVPSKILDRIGNLLALPLGRRAIVHPYRNRGTDSFMKGSHGGMSDNEIFVPLIGSRFN